MPTDEVADAHLAQGAVEIADVGVEEGLPDRRSLATLPEPIEQQDHVQGESSKRPSAVSGAAMRA